MPRELPLDKPPHQVLRGQRTDDIPLWMEELKEATRATGCFDLFFPQLAPARDDEEWAARHSQGTWQSLAWRVNCKTAVHIISGFISGPMWSYLLTRWLDGNLLDAPDEVVKMAEVASAKFSIAPASEREKSRMLYELEHGDPDEYPSYEHFQESKKWLETAVRLSTSKESVEERRALRSGPPLLPVKREAAPGPSMAENPNSSARRRQKFKAEDSLDGPERKRIKLET